VDFLTVVPEFPAPNSKMKMLQFSKQGGGQVATAIVALSRWGVRTKYIEKSVPMNWVNSLSNPFARKEWMFPQ